MKVTFFGTTMLLFDDGKDQVLFDGHPDHVMDVPYIANKTGAWSSWCGTRL